MNLSRLYDILRLRRRSLTEKAQVELELERELKFHLDNAVEENVARGMSRDEARATAKRDLGRVAQIQEECRDMRRTNQFETI